MICDTPGFFDSRGVEIEISNSINLAKFMKNCKSIRPILLIAFDNFKSNRAKSLKKLVSMLSKTIDLNSFRFFLIFYTHAPANITLNDIDSELTNTYEAVNKEN